ncbi:hypothetical protein [Halorussus sp. MSC15.2]|uniref:DUF7262 family protein n=1 Tax=Halorussus sp. MSC15.2 TaxID=2283638 RepID=UPI0013D077ED|nr:hypothetical protein [Halorussus sp. MSC15.2]NEU57742.1 hypothetical protein [Halorussus sp. MSC15.2]
MAEERHRSVRSLTLRGQLSLSVVEAGVGAVLILAVAMGFALGVAPTDDGTAQLDLYAEDAATVLAGEPPRHAGATRLSEVVRSPDAFDRERDALRRRVARILPDNLLFRVRTPRGAVGFRKPAGVAVGSATVTTAAGDVTIWVWYA